MHIKSNQLSNDDWRLPLRLYAASRGGNACRLNERGAANPEVRLNPGYSKDASLTPRPVSPPPIGRQHREYQDEPENSERGQPQWSSTLEAWTDFVDAVRERWSARVFQPNGSSLLDLAKHLHHRNEGDPKNLEVEQQRPVLDVIIVPLDAIRERGVTAKAVYLRPSCDP